MYVNLVKNKVNNKNQGGKKQVYQFGDNYTIDKNFPWESDLFNQVPVVDE